MTPEMWTTIVVGLSILAAIVPVQLHLFERIDEQGRDIIKRIDEQGQNIASRLDKHNERIGALEQAVAALKATIETYFHVRVDQPPPPPEHHDEAA